MGSGKSPRGSRNDVVGSRGASKGAKDGFLRDVAVSAREAAGVDSAGAAAAVAGAAKIDLRAGDQAQRKKDRLVQHARKAARHFSVGRAARSAASARQREG